MWPADPAQRANKTPHAVSRRRRNPRHARQGRVAGAARALARRARRERPLGAAEAGHRRSAHRRLGAAGKNRRRRARQQGARTRSKSSGRAWRRPISNLFAWLEGRAEKPLNTDPAPFRPAMLAHAIEDADFASARSRRLHGGMEMGRHPRAGGERTRRRRPTASRGFIRAPARIFREAFPTCSSSLRLRRRASTANCWCCATAACRSFNVLQQRLNRKAVTPKLMPDFPLHICAPMTCWARATRTCAHCPLPNGATRLEAFVAQTRRRRASICRRWCASTAGTSLTAGARRSGRRPAPARMPTRSKA